LARRAHLLGLLANTPPVLARYGTGFACWFACCEANQQANQLAGIVTNYPTRAVLKRLSGNPINLEKAILFFNIKTGKPFIGAK
jgi:hypothetical protein